MKAKLVLILLLVTGIAKAQIEYAVYGAGVGVYFLAKTVTKKVADHKRNKLVKEYTGYFTYKNDTVRTLRVPEDTVLNEHLHSPQDAMDSDHFEKLSSMAKNELRQVTALCAKKDCAYVRFIDHGHDLKKPRQSIVISNNLN